MLGEPERSWMLITITRKGRNNNSIHSSLTRIKWSPFNYTILRKRYSNCNRSVTIETNQRFEVHCSLSILDFFKLITAVGSKFGVFFLDTSSLQTQCSVLYGFQKNLTDNLILLQNPFKSYYWLAYVLLLALVHCTIIPPINDC